VARTMVAKQQTNRCQGELRKKSFTSEADLIFVRQSDRGYNFTVKWCQFYMFHFTLSLSVNNKQIYESAAGMREISVICEFSLGLSINHYVTHPFSQFNLMNEISVSLISRANFIFN
jgi:hypothetical protein